MQWMSRTPHPRFLLRTPMNMTLCWSFYVTCILPYSWRRLAKINRLEGQSNRYHYRYSGKLVGTKHKTEVSSFCGYELYFWCALCSSGVLHDDHLRNFSGRSFYGNKSDVNNVARVPHQQRSLDCSTQAMIDGSRICPRSVLQADTIIVSYGPANFESIPWSMQRCHTNFAIAR